MSEELWFPIRGFEGRYEMLADGSKVRALPRVVWFGNSRRVSKVHFMNRNAKGQYSLTNDCRKYFLRPDELVPVMPEGACKSE